MNKPEIGDFIMVGEVKNDYCGLTYGEILEVAYTGFDGFYVENKVNWFRFDNRENNTVEYIYPICPAMRILFGVKRQGVENDQEG